MSNDKVGEVSSSDMLNVDLFCAKKVMIAQIDVCIHKLCVILTTMSGDASGGRWDSR